VRFTSIRHALALCALRLGSRRPLCLRLRLNRSKTFSVFSDVWCAVKSKVNGKYFILTEKSVGKIRKTVYGKFFRKPFSKITRASPSSPRPFSLLSFLVSALSLSHCLLSFSLSRATPSRSPPATRLFSFSLSARFLFRPNRAQPARASLSTDRRGPPIPPSLRRTHPCTDLLLRR
jgi:hypothetical protein